MRAFNRDFEVNGPSTMRIVRTTLAGWRRYKNHPDLRIRRRFAWEARELSTTFSAVMGAVHLYYRQQPEIRAAAAAILRDLYAEYGLKSRAMAAVGGRYILRKIHQEEKRLAAGWTYEPPTFYETNFAPAAGNPAVRTRSIACRVVAAPHVALPIVEASVETREEPAATAL